MNASFNNTAHFSYLRCSTIMDEIKLPASESRPSNPRILGNAGNAWYGTKDTGFDLTHGASTISPYPGTALCITTTSSPILLDTDKTALVIVDMQNVSVSSSLGQPQAARDVATRLINQTIPAARHFVTMYDLRTLLSRPLPVRRLSLRTPRPFRKLPP